MGVDQHRGHSAGVAQAGTGSGDDLGDSVTVGGVIGGAVGSLAFGAGALPGAMVGCGIGLQVGNLILMGLELAAIANISMTGSRPVCPCCRKVLPLHGPPRMA